MIDIDNLSEYIEDEIKDAGKYARCAIKHKSENPELAEMFYRLSEEEAGHARMLYDEAMKEVKELRDKYSMRE